MRWLAHYEAMTPEERALVDEMLRDPEKIRQSARIYFEGLSSALHCHCH